MRAIIILTLLSIAFTVQVHSQEVRKDEKECKVYDRCGPYCTGGTSPDKELITDMSGFCKMRGFKRHEFGNGPSDSIAYCARDKDLGSGYRFTCCK